MILLVVIIFRRSANKLVVTEFRVVGVISKELFL